MPRKSAEERKEYQRRYYQQNKERLDEAHKRWRDDNPERIKEINAKASKKYRKTVSTAVIQPDFVRGLREIGVDDK